MKKRLELLLLGVVLGLSTFLSYKIYNTDTTKVKKVKVERLNPIVRLVFNGRTFCSGTVVDMHTIITAAHCVLSYIPLVGPALNTDPIEIRASDNKPLGVYAVAINASGQMDQAVLKGDFPMFEPRGFIADPGKLTVVRQQKSNFVTCGYPLYGDLFCTVTIYDNVDDFYWAVKGVLLPGMSGGPTMLPDGTVIAINSAVESDRSLVSPIYNINQMFKEKAQ